MSSWLKKTEQTGAKMSIAKFLHRTQRRRKHAAHTFSCITIDEIHLEKNPLYKRSTLKPKNYNASDAILINKEYSYSTLFNRQKRLIIQRQLCHQ